LQEGESIHFSTMAIGQSIAIGKSLAIGDIE
jgi:hypothetical protein